MRKRKTRWGRFRDLYLFYAIRKFGFRDGLHRFWMYRLSPVNWYEWAKGRYIAWKLRDRRRKLGYTRTVYAVNRDGNYGLVECPQCHEFQGIYFQKVTKDFDCCFCGIRFDVHLEDGLVRMQDHRDGNIPVPGMCVEDNTGKWHLGIAKDAPWWWVRKDVYRDYNPKTGRDGHNHHFYVVMPPRPQQPGPMEYGETEI